MDGREFPGCPWERYADDGVVHCKSRAQADLVLGRIAARTNESACGFTGQNAIVYCKEGQRRAEHEPVSFTFLGYAFRGTGGAQQGPELHQLLACDQSRGAEGHKRPAPRTAIHRRTTCQWTTWRDAWNPIVSGWINYYGGLPSGAKSPPAARQRLREALGWRKKRLRTQKRTAVAGRTALETARPGSPTLRLERSY